MRLEALRRHAHPLLMNSCGFSIVFCYSIFFSRKAEHCSC
jgi:hypothetical protein